MAFDETIAAGQSGHDSDHEVIHALMTDGRRVCGRDGDLGRFCGADERDCD